MNPNHSTESQKSPELMIQEMDAAWHALQLLDIRLKALLGSRSDVDLDFVHQGYALNFIVTAPQPAELMKAIDSLLDVSLTPEQEKSMTGRMALSYFCSMTLLQADPHILVTATGKTPVIGRLLLRTMPDDTLSLGCELRVKPISAEEGYAGEENSEDAELELPRMWH